MKRAPELSDSVVEPVGNEESWWEKGSEITQNLINPMENHQVRAPESIFCTEYFLYVQKYSHIGLQFNVAVSSR